MLESLSRPVRDPAREAEPFAVAATTRRSAARGKRRSSATPRIACSGVVILTVSRQLIAIGRPGRDVETAPLMVALHRLMAEGQPAATALARAAAVRERGPAAMAVPAGFVCIGATPTSHAAPRR